jgi:cell division transport system permease protein
MRAYFLAHFQAFQRALSRLSFHPATSLLSVLVIGIALTLPLGLYTFLKDIAQATSRLNTDPHINLYLSVAASSDDARAVELRLRSNPRVLNVKFVPRDEAFAEMKRSTHLADLLSGLDTNPLPDAFTMRPMAREPGALEVLRKELMALPKVEYVVMDFEWAQKLARVARFAERLVTLLALILAAAVIFVTGNTIRLQILTQRDEIEVSQLIGATRRFIRRPFLYFGAVQGLMAGLVALAIVAAIQRWIEYEMQALTISYIYNFNTYYFSVERSGWILFGATTLGWLGAHISVSLYFRHPHQA